jgi:dihydrofolate synthase/folylpolyglutamate synthase
MRFPSSRAFQEHLDRLGQFRMKLGLHRIEHALARLDLLRPPYRLVQVLGANGKGSTATFLASLAAEHGLKVGLYTSPHFLSPQERIRIVDKDGSRPLSDALWLEAANHVGELASTLPEAEDSLTYFETLTAMAAWAFVQERVDLAVFEAGLGGRHDATSAFYPELTLFTRIGLDHCAVLGNTIEQIAEDKAGALKPGGRAFSCEQPEAAWRALQAEARSKCARLLPVSQILEPVIEDGRLVRIRCNEDACPGQSLEQPRLGLLGPHQIQNAMTALAGWVCLAQGAAEEQACLRGLARARIPGRLQRVPAAEGLPEILLDGAHNPDGLEALGQALRVLNIVPSAVIFACLADKDLPGMADQVAALGPGPILVPELPDQPRALPAADIAQALEERAPGRVHAARDLGDALARASQSAPGGMMLICGSLFLLAEFFKLRPACLTWG